MKSIIPSLRRQFCLSVSARELILAKLANDKFTAEQSMQVIARIENSIRSEQGKLKLDESESSWSKTKLTKTSFGFGKRTTEKGVIKAESEDSLNVPNPVRAWHWFIALDSFEESTGMAVGNFNTWLNQWIKNIADDIKSKVTESAK